MNRYERWDDGMTNSEREQMTAEYQYDYYFQGREGEYSG